MDVAILFVVIVLSIVVIFSVGKVSQRIFIQQEELAKRIEKMAGIQSIDRIKEKTNDLVEENTHFKSLAQILRVNQPINKVRILTLSGATSLLSRDSIISDLLTRGVEVELMMLDPEVHNIFFDEYPKLLQDIKTNLDILSGIQKKEYSGKFSVRVFAQSVFQMLIFIDDEQLFVSSFVPTTSSSRLIYEIKKGDKSLYTLYEPMFEFLWNKARIIF